jgi:predicted Zn-dependent protease
MDRVDTFKSFIAKAPADPFPRYGLAMELKTRGDLAGAWSQFSSLIEQFPDYVASYLMAGGTLVGLGRKDEAANVYQRGIAAAARRGDTHAKTELEAALAEIS